MMNFAKTFVVCALAALAVGATLASPASAAKWKAGGYAADLLGAQQGEAVLTFEGNLDLICNTGSSSGTLGAESEVMFVEPTFGACEFVGLAATLTAEGCTYGLWAETEFTSISCPAGKVMKMKAGTCEVQIGEQGQAKKATYTFGGVPKQVTAAMALEGLRYNRTNDGFACPLSGKGVLENGKLKGTTVLKAEKEAKQVDLWFA